MTVRHLRRKRAKKHRLVKQRRRRRLFRGPGPRAAPGCSPFPAVFHSEAPTASEVSRAFVDANGCQVVLNAVNIFPGWEAKHFQSIRAKGFNAIRLLIPWRTYEPARGQINLSAIDAEIAKARDAGLYVMIDPFLTDDWNKPPAWATKTHPSGCVNWAASDQIDYIHTDGKGFLQAIARRYKDNPTVVAYDLVGEPHGTNLASCLLAFYSDLIDWVREVDNDKLVVLEPGWGNNDPSFADVAQLRHRRNVIWSWHDYYAGDGDPGNVFAGYNAASMNSGHQTADGVSGYPNPGDAADFEAQAQQHIAFARRAGIALMGAGEYGINPTTANAAAWMEQKTALYQRHKLSRAWWLYTCGENFALKDANCNWREATRHLGL
jgi:Cellulase (glycosyl hydrolase family 5)